AWGFRARPLGLDRRSLRARELPLRLSLRCGADQLFGISQRPLRWSARCGAARSRPDRARREDARSGKDPDGRCAGAALIFLRQPQSRRAACPGLARQSREHTPEPYAQARHPMKSAALLFFLALTALLTGCSRQPTSGPVTVS